MNLYLRELKAHRKSIIIWSLSMAFLVIAGMGKYAAGSGANGAANFNEMMELLPKSLQSVFGVGVFDLSIALDYFGILFVYIVLMMGIQAAMLGSGIISKEERDKTVEFLITKPISRFQIITAKLLSSLTLIIIFNIVTFISSYTMLNYYSKGLPFTQDLTLLMLAAFAIQIFFVALGSFCASLVSRAKLSSAISTSILMTMFMISIIVDIIESISFLKYLSIFKYYDAKDILKGDYFILFPILTFVFTLLLIFGTYKFYEQRDMRI